MEKSGIKWKKNTLKSGIIKIKGLKNNLYIFCYININIYICKYEKKKSILP